MLFVYAFFFAYVIRQHHSGGLGCADEEEFFNSFAGGYEELHTYLTVWGYEGDFTCVEAVFEHIVAIRKETDAQREASFALYALIKLNSSVLTAADYLATHAYMTGRQVKEAGIYEQLDKFVFEYPQEKSGDHLNRLRTGMAVEVIRTVREHSDDRLFYIEAPTGGGKTNLSMLAVTELMAVHPEIQKVFYVFPYTTLITQTNQTLKNALGLTSTELADLMKKRRKERMDCMRIKSRIISIVCLPFFLCALCRM